jgi:DNA-directed RNA polymerase subunit RPC12/RpoP
MAKSNETSRQQIKRQLVACVYDVDNGSDLCDIAEQQRIFNEMQSCIDKIMHLNNRLKRPVEAVEKKPKIARPTLDEVNNYLKSHYTDENCYNTLMTTCTEAVESDLKKLAKQLNETNDRADGSILQVHYILGSQLKGAKKQFKQAKKWTQWVKENVGLSPSYCRKIVTVTDLLTKIYNLRKEIEQLFSNEDIANNWPDELCVICYTNPRVTSGFTSCKHGINYCKACITQLMKERKTEVEVILEDGQIERFMKKIPGKRCPECRTKIVLAPRPPTHTYNLRPRRK